MRASSRRHAKPLEIGLRANQIRASLLDLRLKQRRIEPRKHLTLAHERIEVGVELLDRAGHLSADLHGRDGLKLAGGAHRLGDVAARDARGVNGWSDRLLAVSIVAVGAGGGDSDDASDDE